MVAHNELLLMEKGLLKASVYDGELASFSKHTSFPRRNIYYTFQAALPDFQVRSQDYPRSEFFIFPINGPANPEKDYKVWNGDQDYVLDQHGVSRLEEIPFEVVEATPTLVRLLQTYDGSLVDNPKSVSGDHPPKISWVPYSLSKDFQLQNWGLSAVFMLRNNHTSNARYQAGWHKSFNINGLPENGKFSTSDGRTYNLADLALFPPDSRRVIIVENAQSIRYENGPTKYEFISTGFNHFILWSPHKDASMFCIEPVTHLPIGGEKRDLFRNPAEYNVLKPGEIVYFSVAIKIL